MPRSVLVVDDTSFIRMMLRGILESEECTVHEAVNGRDAIERYRTLAPDLVIMDVVMPELDGLTALAAMREADPRARVVIMSAADHQGTREVALLKGALAFLPKPFAPGRVRDIVTACLAAPPA